MPAIPSNFIAAVVGYRLLKGFFNESSPNLPQNISILAEANDANQAALSTAKQLISSAAQVAAICGDGSPAHAIARILFPQNGAGVGIPVHLYPQLAAGGAAAKVITVTPTGTATAAGTIYLVIGGRYGLDGASYAINIASGDTPTVIAGKMRTAVAAAYGCPVLGSGTTTFVGTTKWKGLTANDVSISIDLNGSATGVTFAVVNTTPGTGTPSITGAGNGLGLFGNEWRTIVINSYGFETVTVGALEDFNGVPDPTTPTGRYAGLIWRPMWAFTGTCADDPTALTSAGARPNNVTLVACPAPLSTGMPYEAAANYAYVAANIFQNMPQGDIMDSILPDMPSAPAGSIPQMNDVTFRNTCLTKGCSTAEYINGATGNGQYKVKDFVTTYNKTGEFPLFYSWVRTLNIHFNYKYGLHLKEQEHLVGKTLVNNAAITTAENVIKPKQWAAIVAAYNLDCEKRALLVNAEANNKSIDAEIDGTNSNKLNTTQTYQISGLVRQSDITSTAGFNFKN